MNKNEIEIFIEEMEEIGDEWDEDEVERVYGDMSLDEALESRRRDMSTFAEIIGKVLNR